MDTSAKGNDCLNSDVCAQDTGLYYLQSRYYDPSIGRFINADALVSTGQGLLGNNMFAYCRNNPVSRIDISGNYDEDLLDADGNPATKEEDWGKSSTGSQGTPVAGQAGGGSRGPSGSTNAGQTNGSSNSNGLGNTTGYGQAPKTGTPGSQYTQISSDGQNQTVSVTTYNEYGQRGIRVDYLGRDHGLGLPHIHTYSYDVINGQLHRTKEVVMVYLHE